LVELFTQASSPEKSQLVPQFLRGEAEKTVDKLKEQENQLLKFVAKEFSAELTPAEHKQSLTKLVQDSKHLVARLKSSLEIGCKTATKEAVE